MNVLAIGARPDDIEYGCGGMLTKYAQRGRDVYLWVASDGALGGDAASAAAGAAGLGADHRGPRGVLGRVSRHRDPAQSRS